MTDALIHAVDKNDVALVKELIGKGVYVDGVDSFGWTPLRCAAGKGFVDCAKPLLESNAYVNKVDGDGWTPLHFASNNGHVGCVKVWWCDNNPFWVCG